ncbi:prolipoprotein diacylglyceryl transferase [Mycobacterium sp. MMS18-G62]
MTTTVLAYIPSPSQGVWHLGVVPIRAYALFIIVGIIAALVIGDRRWAARGGEPGVIYDIALWAVPFGLIGGRLYHVMTDWRTYFGDDGAGLAGAFRIWDGGLGIWGAVALGGVGAWIGCRRKGIPLPAFGDAIAPGIILAQAIGRIGNYFNQELFGRPTTLPWGLEIYERRDANGVLDNLNGVSTGQVVDVYHPTFLYELLWNLLVFAALIYIDRRFKIGHGRLFAVYVAGYCLGRFWVELMRSDMATHIAGIRINSFTSTFVFIGAVVYVMVAPKGREDPASLRGTPKTDEVEDSVETFAKELTAVAATTGVVAAAKAAGEAEDEDAEAVGDHDGDEPDTESEAATEAEQLAYDVAEAPSEDIEEAAEFAVAGKEADEAEVSAEAEELGADVAGVPAENLAEAEEFAAEGDEVAEPVAGGVGAIEPEEAAEAEAAAPEAHEAAVVAAEEAEDVADEVEAEAEAESEDSEEPEPEPEPESDEEPEAVAEDGEEPEAVGGIGAVEGEEAAEAEEAAPEVHEAAVEAADEAEAVADEVAAEAEESEPDETETEDAEAAVGEAVESEPSEEKAAEAEEAVVEEADSAVDEEPSTGVLETQDEAPVTPAPAEPERVEEPRGRVRRWLRRNR